MESESFKDLLFQKAREAEFEDFEMYYEKSESFTAKIFDGEVAMYKNSHSEGLSFRGNYNGRTGYSYTEKTDADVIAFLIEAAKNNALVIEDEKEELYAGSESYIEIKEAEINEISAKEKIDMAKTMEKTAYEADPRITKVMHSVISGGRVNVSVINSKGLNLSNENHYASAYAYVMAEENGQAKTGYEIYLGRDFTGFDPDKTAKLAVKNAVSLLGAKDAETKKCPAVFNSLSMADLLEAFAGVFFAENVQNGMSLLAGKLNGKIASEAVTLNDYAVCSGQGGTNNISFDSEGVAAYNKSVIQDGILKTYLYNRKTAAKDNVESTGNGFRNGFKSEVKTAGINFFIAPSGTSEQELIAQMDGGVYITSLEGMHSGTNRVSGDFSLKADGFSVLGGKTAHPIQRFTVSGNFYELLKNTVNAADNLRFSPGGFGAPSVLVKGLDISGGDNT